MMDHDSKAELNRRLVKGDITPEEYDRIVERIGVDGVQQSEPLPFIGPGERLVPVAPELNNRPKNYFARLWRGYISLPSTYFLWGWLGGALVGVAGAELQQALDNEFEIISVLSVMGAYGFFTVVCIWRSAVRYKQKKPRQAYWGNLAQVLCILGALGGAWRLGTSVPGLESDEDLNEMVYTANAGLPETLGGNVRLDSISRIGRVFTYHYTIIGPSHVPNAAEQQQGLQETISGVCASHAGRRLLLSLDKATYTYVNEEGDTLASYDVARRDCP